MFLKSYGCLSTNYSCSNYQSREFDKNKLFQKVTKIHSGIWQMIAKIPKCNASLQWGKDIVLWHPFLRILYLFDPISSGLVWIDKLHNFREEICFPSNDCHWYRKKAISQLSWQRSLQGKKPSKTSVNWISARWDRISQPQKCKFL